MPSPSVPDLRQPVAELLRDGHAHATLAQALAGLTAAAAGKKLPRAEHTSWQLLEHIRIAQSDILQFTVDPAYVSPPWPEGYWPATAAPPSAAALGRSRKQALADLDAMVALVLDPQRDLFAPLAHARDKTLLREALLLADHNAYHTGQLVAVRKALGAWKA